MPMQRLRRFARGLLVAGACLTPALACPPALHAQGLDLAALAGEWIRVGSNYNPNDQMRIRIAGSQATLTRVPSTGHAAFRVGQALWMAIAPDGSLRVRGSDGAYYPASLAQAGADSLVLSVDQSAAGNDQVWRRAGPTLDGEWVRIAPGDPAADGTRIVVEQDQATVRFLAASAPRAYRIGTRLWQGIAAGGGVRVMDGSGRYQAATLRLDGANRVWVEAPWLPAPELWVRPTEALAARSGASGPLRPPAAPAASTACIATALPHHATGLTWGWALEIPDAETFRAEQLGLLDYRGAGVSGGSIITDLEPTDFNGLNPGFAVTWQRVSRRLTTVEQRNLSAAELATWDQSYRAQDYRMTDLEAYPVGAEIRFAAVWLTNLEGIDWDVRHGLTGAQLAQQLQAQRNAGYRLVDIEAYEEAGQLRHAGIWHRSCDNANWLEFRDMTSLQYRQREDSLTALGYRVVDFESYQTSGGQRYAAIWEQVPGVDWAVAFDRTQEQFLNAHRRHTDAGFRLVDFEDYATAAGRRYAGVWAENDARYRLAFRAAVDSTVTAYRAANRIPGISVAIIQQGELVYRRGFGWADSARSRAAHAGTIYPLASVSKTIAGTLAARLEARGVVDLTRQTRSYVDSLPAAHTHTLEQLLAKTGCVIHYDEGPEPPEQYYRWRRDALRPIRDSMMLPNCTPGRWYHYSTHGFTLLGAALEAATGKDIVQLVNEEIAGPMGLRTLGAQVPSAPADSLTRPPRGYHQAEAYTMDTTRTVRSPSILTAHEDASWKVLGGGLQSDAPDLARFGWLTLSGSAVSDSVRDNRLWRSLTSGLRAWSDSTAAPQVGLAWVVPGTRRAQHGGTAPIGGRSFLLIWREWGIVVAILSNQREGPGTLNHDVPTLAFNIASLVANPP